LDRHLVDRLHHRNRCAQLLDRLQHHPLVHPTRSLWSSTSANPFSIPSAKLCWSTTGRSAWYSSAFRRLTNGWSTRSLIESTSALTLTPSLTVIALIAPPPASCRSPGDKPRTRLAPSAAAAVACPPAPRARP